MLTTAILSAQSLNTPGPALYPTKVTLSATTAVVELHFQLIAAAGTANQNKRTACRAFLAVSPFSIAAADAVNWLREQAIQFDILPNQENGQSVIKKSGQIPALGTYAYMWFEIPGYSAVPSANCSLVEMN